MTKTYHAVFSTEHVVKTDATLETSKPRLKGTRWFNSPDDAMHSRSVKIITKTSGRGKAKKTIKIRRITYR